MYQYTVSGLIKELNKIKKEHGPDVFVKVHLQSCEDANGGDVSHDDFGLYIEKITELDADNNYKPLKKKMKVLSIYGGDFTPDDYKKKDKPSMILKSGARNE